MQPAVEYLLSRRIHVVERRAGMIETEAREIAVDFFEMTGLLDVDSINRVIAVLVPRQNEK